MRPSVISSAFTTPWNPQDRRVAEYWCRSVLTRPVPTPADQPPLVELPQPIPPGNRCQRRVGIDVVGNRVAAVVALDTRDRPLTMDQRIQDVMMRRQRPKVQLPDPLLRALEARLNIPGLDLVGAALGGVVGGRPQRLDPVSRHPPPRLVGGPRRPTDVPPAPKPL